MLSTMSNRTIQRPKVSHSIFPAQPLVAEGRNTLPPRPKSGGGHLAPLPPPQPCYLYRLISPSVPQRVEREEGRRGEDFCATGGDRLLMPSTYTNGRISAPHKNN